MKKNINKKIKKTKKIETNDKLDVNFCTVCNDDLEDYSVRDPNLNVDAALDNHENCKKIGKFDGEMCAKVYIMSDNVNDDELNEED